MCTPRGSEDTDLRKKKMWGPTFDCAYMCIYYACACATRPRRCDCLAVAGVVACWWGRQQHAASDLAPRLQPGAGGGGRGGQAGGGRPGRSPTQPFRGRLSLAATTPVLVGVAATRRVRACRGLRGTVAVVTTARRFCRGCHWAAIGGARADGSGLPQRK